MRNILSEAGACQGLANVRWSGLLVDAADISGFGSYDKL